MKANSLILYCLLSGTFLAAQESGFQNQKKSPDPLDGESLYQIVTRWSQFEDHLTGSDSDKATTQWLGNRLSKAGYQVEFQNLTIPLFDFDGAELKVNDQDVPCYPIWTPESTGEKSVVSPLILLEKDNQVDYAGKFVLVEIEELRMPQFQGALEAVQSGAKGLIINYPHAAGV